MVDKRGRPKSPPRAREMLKEVMPLDDLFDEEELKIYNSLVDIYLKDFDDDDLNSSDLDDILSLAMNKVFELRLFKTSKGNPDRQVDISAAIEKLRRQDDNIKTNLSSRRRDRINPNEFKGFSIVDLAVAFDNERKNTLQEKVRQLTEEEAEILERRKDYVGNRYDSEVKDKEGDLE